MKSDLGKKNNYIEKTSDNKSLFPERVMFLVLLLLYGIFLFLLFRKQVSEAVESDILAYIQEMLGENEKYAFPYPLFFKLGGLFYLVVQDPGISLALALVLLCCLSALALRWGMPKEGNPYVKNLFPFVLLLVSMLYVPTGFRFHGIKFAYMGVFSPNPLHNATYNAARPFAIMTFFLFVRILEYYEERANYREYVAFGVMLFLTTFTKPSYTFVLVPAAGVILVFRFFKSRGRNLMNSILLGLFFLPTGGLLLYQFFGVFGPAEEGERGIGIGFLQVWEQYCENVPLAILLAGLFPLLVFGYAMVDLYKTGEKKRFTEFIFAFGCYVMSLFQFMFLYEKGFRKVDANFSWGYMYGLFFLYVAAVKYLYIQTRKEWKSPKSKGYVRWSLGILWLVLAAHLLCGICYFRGYYLGQGYY